MILLGFVPSCQPLPYADRCPGEALERADYQGRVYAKDFRECFKAFMLPGGPLLPFNPAIRSFPRVHIHFHIAGCLWRSSGKVKKSIVRSNG